MAVAVEILLLVVLISNNIHADIIQSTGNIHHFILDPTADFCSISRWTGEEKELLWNSSGPDPTYRLPSLKVSDSGQYQAQCWTQGNVTHERNSSLLVCDEQNTRVQTVPVVVGQTLELTCDSAGPNQSVQWFLEYKKHKTGNFELTLIDDETPSIDELQLVKNKPSLLVTGNRRDYYAYYHCVEKNHQSCDVLERYDVFVLPEIILRSVGESLELNCSHISENQPHVWRIFNSEKYEVIHNYTLMLPSLTLSHTGRYTCRHSGVSDVIYERYELLVCPKPDPAVLIFTGGEHVTLECNWTLNWTDVHWFMKSNRTKGKVSPVQPGLAPDNVYVSNTSLVITHVSLEDGEEFWCVVEKSGRCVFTSKTLVMFGEPEVDHHLVRSVLLSVVIMMMFVVVVVAVWRSRSRAQLGTCGGDGDVRAGSVCRASGDVDVF